MMKNGMRVLGMLALLLLNGGIANAAAESDRTLSPYFLVKGDSPGTDQLPLQSTSAAVNIAGVIADVTVTQIYKNAGTSALEAIYVFPGSTRAAVYGMTMTIGERKLVARIREREQARRDYEQARQEGRTASLLEQDRPNVFTMNVANILPGDVIVVELKYTELLVPTDGTYEFVYPTVVGPRYSNQPAATAPATDRFVATPYLRAGETVPYDFDLHATIAAGLPIQAITCPTHQVTIAHDGLNTARVALDPAEKTGGNRDFILRYQLAGRQIESGLLLTEGDTENFFLLMVQPPKRVAPEQIPPREYIFIVDVSGSMRGFPLEISKKLLRDLLVGLRPTDCFNVVLFSGGSTVMAESSLPATADNLVRAVNIIDNQHGGGGTELLPALQRALSLPRTPGIARSVVIATDGYVSVEKAAFDLIRTHLNQANFFPFGIGSGVNRYLIEGMARMGAGEPFVITKPDEAAAQAERFRQYIASPVLTGITVAYNGFDAYEVEPLTVPDVLAERPVIVFGKYRGPATGEIVITGTAGNQPYAQRVAVAESRPQAANAGLRYLWARHRIAVLDDYNRVRAAEELKAEVTALGLAYNLLTAYTSFVAIDSVVRRDANGELVTVQQALPLPQGVPESAVGAPTGAAITGQLFSSRRVAAAPVVAPAPSQPYYPAPAANGSGYAVAARETANEATARTRVSAVADTVSIGALADTITIIELTTDGVELTPERLRGLVNDRLTGLTANRAAGPVGASRNIAMELVIGLTGEVAEARVVSTAADAETTNRLLAAIRSWRFPGLQLRQRVTARITFALRP